MVLCTAGYCPVRIDATAGRVQVDGVQASVNTTASLAKASMFGVASSGAPYTPIASARMASATTKTTGVRVPPL